MPLFLPSCSTLLCRLRPFRAIARLSSTNAGGGNIQSFAGAEEPLGLPAQEGYGWPQLEFNESIGPDNRYVISRKLGWGMSSSTWLARDKIDNSYVAVKILTSHHTKLAEQGRVWELQVLERVSRPPSTPHCLGLMSHFTFPGKLEGQHLCLVTKILGGDVKSLFLKRVIFPLPLAKRILLHLLRGIAHIHSRGIVHTDLKHDNIFFDTPLSTDDFDKLLASDPSRRHASHDGSVQAAVSQPLPIPTLQDAMKQNFLVGDFGSAQPIFIHTENEISALPLRPPKIMIGGPWNAKVDIWAFGCLIFELITGRALFKYQADPKYNLDEPNFMLYQMICYTCEDFRVEQLSVSPLAAQFFDSTCNLKANPPLFDYPFEISIRSYKVIEEADVLSTAAFMRRCLRLDPEKRASWFDGVE